MLFTQVENYRLIEPLRDEPSCCEFLAQDQNSNEIRTVKLFHPQQNDRFLREASLLSHMEHPNVVKLHDAVR